MATLRNKRKLAAVSRETPESTRNGRTQNILDPELAQDYISQVSEEVEGRVTKKLSKEFSRTESRILGALSKLDEFLLNRKGRTCSVAVPGTSRSNNIESQGTNEDRPSDDPGPEVEFSSPISGTERNPHMVTGTTGETNPHRTCSKFQSFKHSNVSTCIDFLITLQPRIERQTPCEKLIKCVGITSVYRVRYGWHANTYCTIACLSDKKRSWPKMLCCADALGWKFDTEGRKRETILCFSLWELLMQPPPPVEMSNAQKMREDYLVMEFSCFIYFPAKNREAIFLMNFNLSSARNNYETNYPSWKAGNFVRFCMLPNTFWMILDDSC